MSGLYRSGLFTPIDATIFCEFGWSAQSLTTRFHGLSSGNTSSAARIASASGVSNEIGLSIFGILALRMRSTRAGSPLTSGFFGSSATATTHAASNTSGRRYRIGHLGRRRVLSTDFADERRFEDTRVEINSISGFLF